MVVVVVVVVVVEELPAESSRTSAPVGTTRDTYLGGIAEDLVRRAVKGKGLSVGALEEFGAVSWVGVVVSGWVLTLRALVRGCAALHAR